MTEHNIIQKTPFVTADAEIDDFLDNWQEDEDPTQEDYDEWAVLCSGGFCIDSIGFMEDT